MPSSALVLLARRKYHLRIEFSGRRFRLQDDFLRLRSEAHEFNAHHVSPARQAGKCISSVSGGGHGKFLSSERIGRGDSYAGQRRLPSFDNSSYLKRSCHGSWGGRHRFGRRRIVLRRRRRILGVQEASRSKHEKKEQGRDKRLQIGGSAGFCEAPPGPEFRGPPERIPPNSCMRCHCSGPITITNLGTKTLSCTAPRAKRWSPTCTSAMVMASRPLRS